MTAFRAARKYKVVSERGLVIQSAVSIEKNTRTEIMSHLWQQVACNNCSCFTDKYLGPAVYFIKVTNKNIQYKL